MLELFEIVFLLITLPLIRFRSSFNELISDLLIFPSNLNLESLGNSVKLISKFILLLSILFIEILMSENKF